MAFITVSPMSGNGDATLSVTAAKHTGRASRTNSFTITAKSDATKKATVSVAQVAAADKCVLKEHTDPLESSQQIPFKVSVTSNVAKLYVGFMYIVGASTSPTLNTKYISDWKVKVNGVAKTVPTISTVDSFEITCPEGEASEYVFEVTGTIPVNSMAMDFACIAFISPVKITSSNLTSTPSMVPTGVLVSKATAARLSVDSTSLTGVAANGGSKTVNLTCNDDWTVAIA